MKSLSNGQSVHFIGIGGIGMSSLALHLSAHGVRVTGSDRCRSEITDKLSDSGVKVFIGHNADNIADDCAFVVYTEAVDKDNPELQKAQIRQIPVVSREKLLGEVFDGFDKRVAVCGVHGKTTVSAMIDYLLQKTDISHAAFVGGISVETQSNYTKGSGIAVAEACEFKRSFLCLHPDVIVALNVELDHPDCYGSYEEIVSAFGEFFGNLSAEGVIVANGDCVPHGILKGKRSLLFGCGVNYDYGAENLSCTDGKYSFDLYKNGKFVLRVHVPMCGKHNIYNSLAALAAVDVCGVDLTKAARALEDFAGVKRRWMSIDCGLCNVVEDYAHHPTEIASVVSTAKDVAKGKIYAFFQPHTYTRTKALWQEFCQCFSGCDFVGLLPIYAAREQSIDGVTSEELAKSIENVRHVAYFADEMQAADFIANTVRPIDTVLVIGAGDIFKLSALLKSRR
ncbi:MAG: UDP-N-acetylmuramate--L-alanine ligase [Corallococcus sp.]|nr:UDP-N-acetylmuramate--L-alanine ligase [Corallococcus sp.]